MERRDLPLSDAELGEVFAAATLAGDGSPLLLAVSGGPDSTALMHAAAAWSCGRGGPPLLVATVDHGLRPEARAEAEAVGAAAKTLGLPHAVLTWGHGLARASQSAAREARYRLLVEHAAAAGAGRIATAHTCDDQVETILMRLADGSGLSGLAGMARATRRGPVLHLRPFLHLRKVALVATCKARGWAFAHDPSNSDTRFARARWRALAGALATEGLTPERIARLGGRLRRADIALEVIADRVAAELLEVALPPSPREAGGRAEGARLDFARLAREPEEIAMRVLARALRRVAPGEATRHLRLERVEAALASLLSARLEGARLRRSLAGCILDLDHPGTLTVTPEAPRRRGR